MEEELSDQFSLPYVPAGLKKKNSLIKCLSSHTVNVIFVSIFSRIPGRLFGGFVKNTKLVKIHVPWFTTFPPFNYILNPLLSFLKILKLHRKRKIDFLILYNCVYENVIPGFFAKHLLRIKIIIQYEDGWAKEDKGFFKNILYRCSHKIAYSIADGLIANSKTFLEIFPLRHHAIFRGGIDHLRNMAELKIKRQLNAKMTILFSSTIDHVRGTNLLIDFLNKIDNEIIYNEVKICITGRGNDNLTTLLEKAVCNFNSRGGDAELLGFVSETELRRVYSKTDVFLALQDPDLPFSKYCFPSKVLEFYYCNKPVITTNISDIKGLFPNLIFIGYDIYDLAEKIIFCFNNLKQLVMNNSSNSEFVIHRFSDKENSFCINTLLNKVHCDNA